MEVSVVTTKGQVVIPAKLRRKYGIKIGTKIRFEEENGEIIMLPLTEETIDKNIGFLGTKGKLLQKLMAEKKVESKL
ncbi:spoVT / AbrB like domain protein [bacterium BMS3Abin04]|nr:spoVT / AbrB like domain protein [bacterium BMS3Abin04]